MDDADGDARAAVDLPGEVKTDCREFPGCFRIADGSLARHILARRVLRDALGLEMPDQGRLGLFDFSPAGAQPWTRTGWSRCAIMWSLK